MIYRFADCEVDTKLLELRRDGTTHALDPLEFDLLVFLIENRDRVVTRNELLDALWPGRVVTDSALSSRLKAVRAATGDSGKVQCVIKTAHGRGYRFVADIESPGRPSQPAHTYTPFSAHAVGRDAELGKLSRWFDRSLSGQPELALISGEAGVGKTTLVSAFAEPLASGDDVLVMQGQCIEHRGAGEPYMPLLEALGRAAQRDPKLATLVRELAPAWYCQLAGMPQKPDAAMERIAAGATPGRLLREMADVLDGIARTRATVVLLEDLHWADPSTLEWIDYYSRRRSGSRLLVVLTARPDGPQQRLFADLAARGNAHALRLTTIDEACVTEYLTQRLGLPPAPALAALTFSKTNGFPLFMEALIDHWLEQGLIRKTSGVWIAAGPEEQLLGGVPVSLQQLIEQQLESLDPIQHELLDAAALIGSPFAAALVAHAVQRGDEETEALFGRMARQGRLVRYASEQRWPDGTVTATFEFRHELYRQALHQHIPAAKRARLHLSLGDRLEQAWRDRTQEVAIELADHFAAANEPARALRYFYPAAMKSFERCANREAVAFLDGAIDQIGTLATTQEVLYAERELQLLRAGALISLEGWASEGVEASYERAQTLAQELGLKDESPERYGIAAMYELRGRYRQSQSILESLLEGTPALDLEAFELLACSLFHQGKFAQSKSNADTAVKRYDPATVSHILARYGENPGVCCHGWAALDLWFMGYPDQAIRRSDQSLDLAQEHAYSLVTALMYRTFLHQFRNEPLDVTHWAQRTIEVGEEQGFSFRVAQSSVLGAWARARNADSGAERELALQHLDQALEDYYAMGAQMDVPYYLSLKADVLRMLGRSNAAIEVQLQALAMTSDGRSFFYEAEMHRQHAELQAETGELEAALQSVEAAIAIAKRQGARMLELRALLTHASLNKCTSGLSAIEALLAKMSEGHEAPDYANATAFLARAPV